MSAQGTRSFPFPGTDEEAGALTRAINRWCIMAPDGQRCGLPGIARCKSHDMLADQRTVEHLIFYRRIAAKLRTEEWLRRG